MQISSIVGIACFLCSPRIETESIIVAELCAAFEAEFLRRLNRLLGSHFFCILGLS
jgi:hypothetical protein